MRIKARELLEAHEKIVRYLEDAKRDDIDIDDDYYWHTIRSQRYEVSKEPNEFTLGKLSEDKAQIDAILGGNEPVGYSLVWLAALLEAYGERVRA